MEINIIAKNQILLFQSCHLYTRQGLTRNSRKSSLLVLPLMESVAICHYNMHLVARKRDRFQLNDTLKARAPVVA